MKRNDVMDRISLQNLQTAHAAQLKKKKNNQKKTYRWPRGTRKDGQHC